MHASRTFVAAFASALLFTLPAALHAQNQVVIRSGGGIGGFGEPIGPGSNPTGPYTMTTKTTTVQKLANGVTITTENTQKCAVDSYGRTYNEQHFDRPRFVPKNLTVFSVFDPVNRTSMNWNSDVRTVTVFHQPDPVTLQRVPPPQPPIRINITPIPLPKPQIEDLGSQTILGLTAKGTRVTQTIPAGQEGNDQPFTVTTEQWRSTDLGINLITITDDPRNGTTTTEVTDFGRGEPDPSLFQIPEGYTIRDINPQN